MSITRLHKALKRVLVGTLAASMCFSTVALANMNNVFTTAKAAASLGDVTGDGSVRLDDAQEVLQFALGINTPTSEQKAVADVDGNGSVNLDDALEILMVALGIKKFETPKPDATSTPAATGEPSASTKPTLPPVATTDPNVPIATQTPYPTAPPISKVEPGTAVEGIALQSLDQSESLHGATVDEKGIYTITDASKAANCGIQLTNPWKGRTDLNQTVESALPVYFKDGTNNVIAKVNGNDLLALDGSGVIGTVKREEETMVTGAAVATMTTTAEAIHIVTSAAKASTMAPVAEISGKIETWSISVIPSEARVEGRYNANYKECYARPTWKNGLSVSFWVKSDWHSDLRTDVSPTLVIRNSYGCDHAEIGGMSKAGHTGDFAFMLRLSGGVSYEGDMTGNCFRTQNYTAGNNHEWNYYTVTFANDWITVYVNGQELVYYTVEMSKKNINYINNGFMTRYSPEYEIKKSDYTDPRRYLKAGWPDNAGNDDTLHIEYAIIGNSRYANPGAVTEKKSGGAHPLLIDSLTGENTEIWIGNPTDTQCVALHSQNTGWVNQNFISVGTQFTDFTAYDKELKADEVAANYEKEFAANADKLSLTH